jgi:hypothetical protein
MVPCRAVTRSIGGKTQLITVQTIRQIALQELQAGQIEAGFNAVGGRTDYCLVACQCVSDSALFLQGKGMVQTCLKQVWFNGKALLKGSSGSVIILQLKQEYTKVVGGAGELRLDRENTSIQVGRLSKATVGMELLRPGPEYCEVQDLFM